jgi:large subunit ribosomal protein L32
VTKCSNCGKSKLSHRVCPSCGYYKGKQVITIKSKSKDKVVEA